MNNPKKIQLILLMLAGWGIWFGVVGISTISASPRCYQLFGEKRYFKAATCFKRAALQIPKGTRDRFARGFRSHLLRNSAMSFLKASKQSNRPAVKAYHAEQTVRMIRWLLRENLCSNRLHCMALQAKAHRIESTILYKKLRVTVPQGRRVRLVIRGYRFRATVDTNKPWVGKVRPGRYVVVYQYSREKPRQHRVDMRHQQRQRRAVVLVVLPPPQLMPASQQLTRIPKRYNPPQRKKPNIVRVVKKLPPQKRVPMREIAMVKQVVPQELKAPVMVKKPSIIGPVVLLSVAGAAVTAGSILLGVGYGGAQQLQQETQSLRTQSGTRSRDEQIASAKAGQSASALLEKFGSLETQATTGWVMASSGAAIGVASMIWWLMQRGSTQKKPDSRSRTLFKTQSSN